MLDLGDGQGFAFCSLAAQQLGHGDAERFGKRQQQGDVRQAQPALPFADRLVGDEQLFAQLLLGQSVRLAQLGDKGAELFHID